MNIKSIDGTLTDEKRTALVVEPPLLDKDVIAECVRHLGEGTIIANESGVIFIDAEKSTADFVKIISETLQCCEKVVTKRRQQKEDAHAHLLARLKQQTGLPIKGEKKPNDY